MEYRHNKDVFCLTYSLFGEKSEKEKSTFCVSVIKLVRQLFILCYFKYRIMISHNNICKDKCFFCMIPTLDQVRELRKYDVGAVFSIGKGNNDKAIELIWKYVIDVCLKDNATVGNANALEDAFSPLGVEMSECVGLVKVAKNCSYSK